MKPLLEKEFSVAAEVSPEEVLGKRNKRRRVELCGYICRADQSIVDIRVVDLSYDGCAIRTVVPLRSGERVKLSVLGQGAHNAVVRWYDSRKAGLMFLADAPTRAQWPRKADRSEVSGEVALRRAGQRTYRVKLFDLTQFGCKCEFVERPTVYEKVWVKFDSLESVEAVVCWIQDSAVGLMFPRPFHPAVLELMRQRLNANGSNTKSRSS